MELIYYLLPVAVSLGAIFLFGFLLAVRAGQFDDLDTPSHRILLDDERGETRHE